MTFDEKHSSEHFITTELDATRTQIFDKINFFKNVLCIFIVLIKYLVSSSKRTIMMFSFNQLLQLKLL